MKSVSKFKHQVKSSKYYLFWGAATIAVMAGQIYVGNGYRQMSESMDCLLYTSPSPRDVEESRMPSSA